MRRFVKLGVCAVAIAAAALTLAPLAEASIKLPNTANVTGTGPYTWSYTINLTDGEHLEAGDFFTIFDFAGFVAGSNTQPNANWTFTTELVATGCPGLPGGVCGAGNGDDPTVLNLKWTYNNTDQPAGQQYIGPFTANSVYDTPATDGYIGKASPGPKYTSGNTQVPVPEPGTMLLLGTGLLGLARAARRNKK